MQMPEKCSNATTPQSLPAWLGHYVRYSILFHDHVMQIVHISEHSILGMRRIREILKDDEGSSNRLSSVTQLDENKNEALLMQFELNHGFPVLHGFAVVALWSWLEHFVKGFLALWILYRKDALNVPVVQKLKVRLGEYLQLEGEEQSRYLLDLLESELGSPRKRGVTRFESLLEPFGLSGPLPDGCAEALFELQQVRNAIVHNNGCADRKLITACPWLGFRLEQVINVSNEMLDRYSDALGTYTRALVYRAGDLHGIDLRARAGQVPPPSAGFPSAAKPLDASGAPS